MVPIFGTEWSRTSAGSDHTSAPLMRMLSEAPSANSLFLRGFDGREGEELEIIAAVRVAMAVEPSSTAVFVLVLGAGVEPSDVPGTVVVSAMILAV